MGNIGGWGLLGGQVGNMGGWGLLGGQGCRSATVQQEIRDQLTVVTTFFALAPLLMESFSLKMGTVPMLSRSSTVAHRLDLKSLSMKSLQVTSTCTCSTVRQARLGQSLLACQFLLPVAVSSLPNFNDAQQVDRHRSWSVSEV